VTALDRRRLVVGGGVGVIASAAPASAGAADDMPAVVYHLSDSANVAFVLGNMRNHIAGMGGADKVKLALVVHGPPLRALSLGAKDQAVAAAVAALRGDGVAFFACVNTMRGLDLSLRDLLPGFAVAEQGGVVKLAELQRQGWAYLRP
jgi:uncharacterized protein